MGFQMRKVICGNFISLVGDLPMGILLMGRR